MRDRYRARFRRFIEYYHKNMLESHIDHTVLYTTTPYDRALFAYLQKRARLL
jgi:transposase